MGLATLGLAAVFTTAAALAQTGRSQLTISAVRHWNAAGATRVAIEVSGEFEYRTDRLHDPERVYYDILDSRPKFNGKRLYTEDLNDPFVKRIRVAETTPGVTRIVLDLTGSVDANASIISSPNRLIVELRGSTTPITTSAPATVASAPEAKPIEAKPIEPKPIEPKQVSYPEPVAKAMPASHAPVAAPATTTTAPASMPPATTTGVNTPAAANPPATAAVTAPASTPPSSSPVSGVPKAAHLTTSAGTSLVRTLGLKLQRVVIDPGHGGHDDGTQGPKGLLEKELVLDVSLRLGKLIEEKLGAEVIYTRTDDTFIPLEGRTALANEKKADLFLSIHANSSPVPRITGVETYYLNFTDSKDAMEVAARENAGAEQSISDLRDIIQKISLHDKASESRDFAERIQSALFAFSAKNFPSERNRGVKKAPFVVLIGANMPSVLAEIGFVSNSREEALLKKPEYRQKLAEALFHGVSKYAESLSHFQMAAN